eukprot:1189874-Prorocentrum_minimum.AAC.9
MFHLLYRSKGLWGVAVHPCRYWHRKTCKANRREQQRPPVRCSHRPCAFYGMAYTLGARFRSNLAPEVAPRSSFLLTRPFVSCSL